MFPLSSLHWQHLRDLQHLFGAITEINLHTAIKITVVEVAVHKVHVGSLPFTRWCFRAGWEADLIHFVAHFSTISYSSSDRFNVAMEMDIMLPQTWWSNILSNESGVLSCWFEHILNFLLINQIAWSELIIV